MKTILIATATFFFGIALSTAVINPTDVQKQLAASSDMIKLVVNDNEVSKNEARLCREEAAFDEEQLNKLSAELAATKDVLVAIKEDRKNLLSKIKAKNQELKKSEVTSAQLKEKLKIVEVRNNSLEKKLKAAIIPEATWKEVVVRYGSF